MRDNNYNKTTLYFEYLIVFLSFTILTGMLFAVMWGTNTQEVSCEYSNSYFQWITDDIPCSFTLEYYIRFYVFFIVMYVFFKKITNYMVGRNISFIVRLLEFLLIILLYYICLMCEVSISSINIVNNLIVYGALGVIYFFIPWLFYIFICHVVGSFSKKD